MMEQVISNGVTYDVVSHRSPKKGEYYLTGDGVQRCCADMYHNTYWILKPVKWVPKEGEAYWSVTMRRGAATSSAYHWNPQLLICSDNAASGNVYQYKHQADVTADKINSILKEL
jgi:hypothetical protein